MFCFNTFLRDTNGKRNWIELTKTEHKDYNLINTKFITYKKEGFIEATTDASGRRQYLKLTDRGMVLVGQRLVVSPDSSNSSIS